MPTEKPRVTILIPQETLDAINNYRFQGKFKNLTQAILSLIEVGLTEIQKSDPEKDTVTTELSPNEADMIKRFRELDARGKATVDTSIDLQKKLHIHVQHKFSLADALQEEEERDKKIKKRTSEYRVEDEKNPLPLGSGKGKNEKKQARK